MFKHLVKPVKEQEEFIFTMWYPLEILKTNSDYTIFFFDCIWKHIVKQDA